MPVCVEFNVLPVYMLMLTTYLCSVKSSSMCVCVDEVHILEDCMFPLTTVPSAAPQHMSVSASTPRSAVVMWRDPPLDDQNGQIVHYVVRYFPADDRSSVREKEVEAAKGQDDVITYVVDQLQPFTTYEFAVAAATAAGQGPFSNPSSVRMPQDGKLEARGSVY